MNVVGMECLQLQLRSQVLTDVTEGFVEKNTSGSLNHFNILKHTANKYVTLYFNPFCVDAWYFPFLI